MASGTTSCYNPHNAYTKVVLRLMICAPKVMRRLLSDYVITTNCKTLEIFLIANGHRLNKTGYQHFYNKLFPKNGCMPSLESWDISMLYHVISNLCRHLLKQGRSNLQNLQRIRNDLCHNVDAKINEKEFGLCWKQIGDIISDTLTTINDAKLQQEIENDVEKIENGEYMEDYTYHHRQLGEWCRVNCQLAEKMEEVHKGQ